MAHPLRQLRANARIAASRVGSQCTVAACATARPVLDVKDVLAPEIALTILMESAIYASTLTKF